MVSSDRGQEVYTIDNPDIFSHVRPHYLGLSTYLMSVDGGQIFEVCFV